LIIIYIIELGCHRGHIYDIINSRPSLTGTGGVGGIETLIQCDMSTSPVEFGRNKLENTKTTENYVKTHFHVCDEEKIPFKDETFDLVLSSMNMHWINDLPSSLVQVSYINIIIIVILLLVLVLLVLY
jgi:NADH dehydrogenase [ubiquinone] 1 alpha subcomplex assembly factor 5